MRAIHRALPLLAVALLSVAAPGAETLRFQPPVGYSQDFEVEVMWPTGRPQTFPVKGYAVLIVEDDLG